MTQLSGLSEADIRLLKTRVVNRYDPELSLSNPNFRNVSIITSWNSYRDKLNDIGCTRFAQESGQALCHFYSVDRWKTEDKEQRRRPKSRKVRIDPKRKSDRVGPRLQSILWEGI